MQQLFYVLIFFGLVTAQGWRVYPKGVPVEITIEHELIYSVDTVLATHWHRTASNKFYVITPDSLELWVDNVRELR